MNSTEKYVNDISNLIWSFIAEESYKISKKILPKNQTKFLADINLFQTDLKVIFDYLYVIDRFRNTKIFPQKYQIKYSTKFVRDGLNEEENKNLDLIITTIQNGKNDQFESINNFYPNSSNKYISKPYKSSEHRYNVDFAGSIWGIKHLHLKPKKRGDNLLYYSIIEDVIYFLAIGNHCDMYNKNILEIVVNEFPDILANLGIGHYNDMTFNSFDNMSGDEIKQKWIKGENIGFFINEKFFVSSNSMTFSKIKGNLNYEISNISYQINSQAVDFIKSIFKDQELDYDLNIVLDEYKDLSSKELLIKEENQKIAQFFYITYLQQLNETKELINIYCNNNK